MKYKAAIDLSGQEATFAVADLINGKIIFEEYCKMGRRDSSSLTPWMLSCLGKSNIDLSSIIEWTVGIGPGSFTGMRMASALISGVTFGKKDIASKGVPTALAFAASLNSDSGDAIAVLYDGRNKELLMFGAENANDKIRATGAASAFAQDKASEALSGFRLFAAWEKDRESIEKIIHPEIAARVKYFEHLPVAELLSENIDSVGFDMTELVYIRPAVFVEPIKTRKVV